MPLFMDLHKASDYNVKPTMQEIKQNHIADLTVQHKYGVRFIQYWINEEDGLVFCMMEAPNKEACAAVHNEAHGDMACNIIELKGGDYQAFLGDEGRVNQDDIVEYPDGALDTGFRALVIVEIIELEPSELSLNSILQNAFQQHKGREVEQGSHRIMAAFNSSAAALNCALEIRNSLLLQSSTIELRIGISAGEPVTEKRDGLFSYTIQLGNRLCDITPAGKITLSQSAASRSNNAVQQASNSDVLNVITLSDEQFLNTFFDVVESKMDEEEVNLTAIGREVGLSRAQLYRKITTLTDRSPGDFIKELKLKKALKLLQQRYGNIAEIAFESGFNSPSYFAKVFQKRFGMLPSQFLGK